MAEGPAALRVRIEGLLRGRDLDEDALLSLEDDGLVLAAGRARLLIELDSLDGRSVSDDALELFLGDGDVIRLFAPDPAELSLEVERRVLRLPEFTRSLRSFGSRRAAGGGRGSEHDGFFAPLIAARSEAERATTLEARCAAFDAPVLRAGVERRLRDFASERYPTDAPERRALEAELFDCAALLLQRFELLERVQSELARCAGHELFRRWREWGRAVGALFESADQCWPTLGVVLAEERREESVSRWSRLTRRSSYRRSRG